MLKSVHSGFGMLLMLFCTTVASAQEAWIEKVASQASPAVVTVLSFDEKDERIGLGSGFIVRSDGLIVTNYHVIQGGASVEVRSKTIGAYNVSGVVAVSREKDFAVLKINAANLPVIRLGNSSDVKLGESVMVIGNPKGLTGTISAGLISQFRQEESFSLLQTSAPIYPGNSGGPLINKRGEVIGVVTARFGDSPTLGLALPVNHIAAELRKGTEVSHSLATLARIEKVYAEKEAEEKLKSILRENFARYTDPDGLYSLIVPKNWRVQREQTWNEARTALSQTTVIAPENAALAQLHGYVSEGIRISVTLPPEGKIWTQKTISKYEETVAQGVLKTNPGFAQTDSQMVSLSDQPVRMYQFVGQDRRLPEPEKTVMYVIARPQALMTIELIAPTSKLKLLDVLRLFSAASFTLHTPAAKPQIRATADNVAPMERKPDSFRR
jgi:S1-C subfamily serine protease